MGAGKKGFVMICEECVRDSVPVKVSLWYMHDNHTFSRLEGTVDEVVARAKRLVQLSPYGMLCPPRILNSNDHPIRQLGRGIHARENGFSDVELDEWVQRLRSDPDALRLMGGT